MNYTPMLSVLNIIDMEALGSKEKVDFQVVHIINILISYHRDNLNLNNKIWILTKNPKRMVKKSTAIVATPNVWNFIVNASQQDSSAIDSAAAQTVTTKKTVTPTKTLKIMVIQPLKKSWVSMELNL